LLLLIIALSFAATMSAQHLAQELAYNRFADHRVFLGIPNFGDVTSNLAFLIVGFVGLKLCLTNRIDGARWSWIVFFVGVALVSLLYGTNVSSHRPGLLFAGEGCGVLRPGSVFTHLATHQWSLAQAPTRRRRVFRHLRNVEAQEAA